VLGLSVHASERALARQAEKIEKKLIFGGGMDQGEGPLPLRPAPDAGAVREAVQRLRDPHRRLVDEFFWFWPLLSERSQADQALAALERDDCQAAEEIWLGRPSITSRLFRRFRLLFLAAERDGRVSEVAAHNLAVLDHVTALDLEHAHASRSQPLDPEEARIRVRAWRGAYRRWKALLEDEGFWRRLTARIQEFDDPRLKAETALQFRASLPLALLSINAQLAVREAELGRRAEALSQIQIMRGSGFEPGACDEALRRAVKPIGKRLEVHWKTAESEARANPGEADHVARRLLTQAEPFLKVIDCLFEPSDAMSIAAHDDVAGTALACQELFCAKLFDEKAGGTKVSPGLEEHILYVSSSESLRQQIKQHRENVKGWALHYLMRRCEAAKSEAEANPGEANRVVYRLLERTRPHLSLIDYYYQSGPDASRRIAAHDRVVRDALRCYDLFVDRTENWGAALGLLKPLLNIAASEELLGEIKREEKHVKAEKAKQAKPSRAQQAKLEKINAELINFTNEGNCWFCRKRPKQVSEAAVARLVNGRRYKVVDVPRCSPCRRLHLARFAKRANSVKMCCF